MPPEFLEKDITNLDLTAFDQAKSCAASKPAGCEINDSELGVPVRLDGPFASRNSSVDFCRCRDAAREVGADLWVHVQSLEIWKVGIFKWTEAETL